MFDREVLKISSITGMAKTADVTKKLDPVKMSFIIDLFMKRVQKTTFDDRMGRSNKFNNICNGSKTADVTKKLDPVKMSFIIDLFMKRVQKTTFDDRMGRSNKFNNICNGI
jgi:predicted MPP superfamily phosphohydrolase